MIWERDEMRGGEVLDSLLETWAFAHDAELAKAAGMKPYRANRFAGPVSQTTYYDPGNGHLVGGAEVLGDQRPDASKGPLIPISGADGPSAEAEIPPSKRGRQ